MEIENNRNERQILESPGDLRSDEWDTIIAAISLGSQRRPTTHGIAEYIAAVQRLRERRNIPTPAKFVFGEQPGMLRHFNEFLQRRAVPFAIMRIGSLGRADIQTKLVAMVSLPKKL